MFISNTGLNILKSNIQQSEVYEEAMYSVLLYREAYLTYQTAYSKEALLIYSFFASP